MRSIRSRSSSALFGRRLSTFLYFVISLALSSEADAGTGFFCIGNVVELGLGQDGTVNIKLSVDNDVHGICNTETQMAGGIVVSACKAAFGTLLANRMMQTPVRVYYNSNATTTSCTTFPSWGNMPAYFVEVPSP